MPTTSPTSPLHTRRVESAPPARLAKRSKIPNLLRLWICSLFVLWGLASGSTFAQCVFTEDQFLFPMNLEMSDRFGRSVTLCGDTAMFGSLNGNGNEVDSGTVHCFEFDGTRWNEGQLIFASDGRAGESFGIVSALSGDVLAVSAERAVTEAGKTGAVYMFRRHQSQWVEEQKLVPDDISDGDVFGRSLNLDGEVLVVGDPGQDTIEPNRGVAYVFRYDGETWIQESKINGTGTNADDNFGYRVCIEGDLIVVGAPWAGADQDGRAFVFRHDGSDWIQEQKLKASQSNARAFGGSVASFGDVIAVGAPTTSPNPCECEAQGAVYVYRFDGEDWIEEQVLMPDGLYWDASMGWDVEVAEDRIVASAPLEDRLGKIFVYEFDGSSWQIERILERDSGFSNGFTFGLDIDIDGDRLLAGLNQGWPVEPSGGGAVYFDLSVQIALDIEPSLAAPGTPLEIRACGGTPGQPSVLVVLGVNSHDLYLPVLARNFDAAGAWSYSTTAPVALSGQMVAVKVYSLVDGRLACSNIEREFFQ